MLDPSLFLDYMEELGVGFVTGVPDSQLKSVCEEVYCRYGINSKRHIVAVNEGNAVALASGFYLATGKLPLVYLQNSGLGNAVNPITSLTDSGVYGIPMIFMVGWRGEPGVHDEPQHIKQGAITQELLALLDVPSIVIDKGLTLDALKTLFSEELLPLLAQGKSVALVVRKGSFEKGKGTFLAHDEELGREEVISSLAQSMGPDDFVVSTTGKISRELFEFCKNSKPANSSHNFLTVGSMGHASAIALSIALQRPTKSVWCFDGDGAALMHMGGMATIGVMKPANYIHVVLNNEAHESVGGMPTVAGEVDLGSVALACGYRSATNIRTQEQLTDLHIGALEKPAFIQVFVGTGSREELMRPDTTPQQNKVAFMEAVQS